jgi:signal transduction histidine kinase/DNA-binding LacI/PurR family transcriptional regulator
MAKRPIIGLLVNDLVGSYQYGHWIGLEEKARELDCDFISFSGGELNSTWLNKQMRNAAFELATPADIDAVILMAPAVANTLSPAAIKEFAESFAPMKVVSAGLEIPGIPTVLVDNAAGMEAAVEHVVGYHGKKRPAYLGGPEKNPEAIERRDAFLRVLAKHNLQSDPRLDLVAQFDFGIGRQKIRELVESGVPFDAVIAANDEMALGAMEALKECGIKIPEDVIVTGFDDIEDAMFSTPALSSVRQPVVEQGRLCMSLALDMMAGKPVPSMSRQPANLIARGSCGCHSLSIAEGRCDSNVEPSQSKFGSPECLQHIRSELGPTESYLVDTPEFVEFFSSLVKESLGIVLGISLVPFEKILAAHSHDEDDNDRWQLFLSRLRRACNSFLPRGSEESTEIDGVFHQLRLVAHERAVQHSAYRSMKIERWTRQLHETGSHLITTFDVKNLIETLARDLPLLQLNSCHILIRDKKNSPDQLRLILSYSQGKRYDIPSEGQVVSTKGAIRSLAQLGELRGTLAVEPLFFEDTPLGFALLELAPRRGMLLDALRTQVSAALMGARLAVEVSARTKELEAALTTLEKNQRQLVLSEKMASLGKLTAGIAHEMNTPLSAMRSSLEEMRRLTEEYRESIGDTEVGPDDHQEIAKEMARAVDIAIRAGDKASGFVRSIKSQTRDMGAKDKQIFDCVRVVEEAILILSHALRASRCETKLEIVTGPVTVLGIPDRLAQVVTNLVTNAIDAMEPAGGIINVVVDVVDGETRISVRDTGSGISPEHISKIFDPLFTTKPVGKGTGLGLTIIHDIVHGDFGGRIEVDSAIGKGTTFTVRLPEAKEA